MLAVAGVVFPIVEDTKRTAAIRPCPCCQQPMKFMGVHENKHARPTSLKTPISNTA